MSRRAGAADRSTDTKSNEARLSPLIDQLELQPLQLEYLRRRWLEQLEWNDDRSTRLQGRYRALRLTTIVGGVLVPALIGLNVSGPVSEGIRWTVFAIGLVVALAAAIEGFYRFGDRWSHYRRATELMTSEGWQFLQLSGQYSAYSTHADAFPRFVSQIEALIQEDVDAYFTTVVAEQPQRPEPTQPEPQEEPTQVR
jgi:Protein of unknown function (DUF4231)